MDGQGNMALGYSVSSSSVFPAIRYTGRLVGDTLSTMQAETSIIEGTGAQSGQKLDRWGDYSAMTIDPVDDCTFWYTNVYLKTTGAFNWSTRIGSLKFPGCGGGKQDQTITFPAVGAKTYSSGGTFAVAATASSGLTVTFGSTTPTVCTVAGTTVTILTAGTCTITANQAGNGSYNAAPQVSQDIAIGKAAQTIAFTSTDATAAVGGATYGPTATGGASGNPVTFSIDASSTAGACTINGSGVVSFTGIGNCVIAANQAGNTNYNAAPTKTQTVVVAKGSQTISFPAVGAKTYSSGGTFSVAATATSGLTVMFGSTTPAVCTVVGTTVTILTAGTCTITADQPGNTNYNAAPQVSQGIAIGKADQTISFPAVGAKTFSPSGTFSVAATATSGLTVTFGSTTTTVCTVVGTTVTIQTAGTCTITADQAGNSNYNAASRSVRALRLAKPIKPSRSPSWARRPSVPAVHSPWRPPQLPD